MGEERGGAEGEGRRARVPSAQVPAGAGRGPHLGEKAIRG